jgi:hypothetical protein
MVTKTQTKRRVARREPEKQKETTGDMASKYFLPFAAVITSAVFYFTGWVYISHWYSYYGIDATQINIPLQLILLHGFPGVLFLATCSLLALLRLILYKYFTRQSEIQFGDLPTILIGAYLIASLLICVIIFVTISIITIPVEVWFSLFGLIVILIVSFLANQLRNILQIVVVEVTANDASEDKIVKEARKHLSIKRIIEVSRKHGVSSGISLLLDWSLGNKTSDNIDNIVEGRKEFSKNESQSIKNVLWESWRFWIIAIVIFYFLISVSSSALFGEWDAARGGRFLIGNGRIPEISLYTAVAIPALEKFEIKLNSGYEYKSLGLLSSDDKVYYLVDWKITKYYQQKPQVYIVPRNDNLILSFIVSPFGYRVPIPLPTITLTPTSIPPVAITPTP